MAGGDNRTVLTEEAVEELRRDISKGMTQKQIQKKYRIGAGRAARFFKDGESLLPDPKRTNLSDGQIEFIRQRFHNGETLRSLAEEFNVASSTLHRRLNGLTQARKRVPAKHLMPDERWQDDALCKNFDPKYWIYPGRRTGMARITEGVENYKQARQVCGRCPVRAACLKAAVGEDTTWTTRGGQMPVALKTALAQLK